MVVTSVDRSKCTREIFKTWVEGKQGMEEQEVEGVIDVSVGARGLGSSEEGVGLGEIWGTYV